MHHGQISEVIGDEYTKADRGFESHSVVGIMLVVVPCLQAVGSKKACWISLGQMKNDIYRPNGPYGEVGTDK